MGYRQNFFVGCFVPIKKKLEKYEKYLYNNMKNVKYKNMKVAHYNMASRKNFFRKNLANFSIL